MSVKVIRWRRIPGPAADLSGLWVTVDPFGTVWEIEKTWDGQWFLDHDSKGDVFDPDLPRGVHEKLRDAKAAVQHYYDIRSAIKETKK